MGHSAHSNTLLDTAGIDINEGISIAIVHTEWNDKIVAEQMAGARRILEPYKVEISTYAVPGSFELPYACRQVAIREQPAAIIAFGAVIRGGTPHFDYVCNAVTDGITQLNVNLDTPVIFGVLTLDTEQQAWERLGGEHGHKGEEAAITALKMIHFNRNLSNS